MAQAQAQAKGRAEVIVESVVERLSEADANVGGELVLGEAASAFGIDGEVVYRHLLYRCYSR